MTTIARAPGRISLGGGGTDLPAYYERYGGAVVSLALPTHAYAHVSARASGLELVSLDHGSREVIPAERFARRMRYPFLAEEFLTLQKAVAWHFGLDRARFAASSELPAGGGLGASAAVCVALVAAAAAYLGENVDRTGMAEIAARIEMSVLRRPCGKQDQYTSAFGGLHLYEFSRDGSVAVTPVAVGPDVRRSLEEHLILFSNGGRRNAAGPLAELVRRCTTEDAGTLNALAELKAVAYAVRDALEADDVSAVGSLLDRGWSAKRRLHSQVTSPEIDRAYALAMEAGALGGKLTGAGLAGSMLFVCPPSRQDDLRRVLGSQGWRSEPVRIEDAGASLYEEDSGALSG